MRLCHSPRLTSCMPGPGAIIAKYPLVDTTQARGRDTEQTARPFLSVSPQPQALTECMASLFPDLFVPKTALCLRLFSYKTSKAREAPVPHRLGVSCLHTPQSSKTACSMQQVQDCKVRSNL